jgi:hypothetical protein
LKITERDIFNFVFYPESFNADNKDILSSIEENSEEINFYRELKNALTQPLQSQMKKKIAEKIEGYKLSNLIALYPLHEPLIKHKTNYLILAAASEDNTPKMVTKTFVDDGKDYLIKLLTYGDKTKVFVFSTHDEIVKDFDIVIQPQNLRFHIEDNTEPLKIDQAIEAEQISLEF